MLPAPKATAGRARPTSTINPTQRKECLESNIAFAA